MSAKPTINSTYPHGEKVYFRCSAGKGGGEPVTVVLTKHNTFVCLTCVTADTCAHSRAARDHYEEFRADIVSAENQTEHVLPTPQPMETAA